MRNCESFVYIFYCKATHFFSVKCFPTPCFAPDPLNPRPPVCGNDGVTYERCPFFVEVCQNDGKLREVSDKPCPPSKFTTFIKFNLFWKHLIYHTILTGGLGEIYSICFRNISMSI